MALLAAGSKQTLKARRTAHRTNRPLVFVMLCHVVLCMACMDVLIHHPCCVPGRLHCWSAAGRLSCSSVSSASLSTWCKCEYAYGLWCGQQRLRMSGNSHMPAASSAIYAHAHGQTNVYEHAQHADQQTEHSALPWPLPGQHAYQWRSFWYLCFYGEPASSLL